MSRDIDVTKQCNGLTPANAHTTLLSPFVLTTVPYHDSDNEYIKMGRCEIDHVLIDHDQLHQWKIGIYCRQTKYTRVHA